MNLYEVKCSFTIEAVDYDMAKDLATDEIDQLKFDTLLELELIDVKEIKANNG